MDEPLYAVYHSNDTRNTTAPQMSKVDWFLERGDSFLHVADVQAPLQSVVERTTDQEGGGEWRTHAEVRWHISAMPIRSTTVGDVIFHEETQRVWVVTFDASLEEFTPPPLLPLK